MTQRRKEDWLKRREAEKEKIGGEVDIVKLAPTFARPRAKRTNEDSCIVCLNT